jgi:ribosomal protein S18 acetylase RimI-like enzyme
MHFRTAIETDVEKIKSLYKAVANSGDGIARKEHEVTTEYVEAFVRKSSDNGLIIVAEHPDDPERLVAEIHAYKSGIDVFAHVLSELTIVVHPDFQRKKIGRMIFTIFLEEVVRNRADILKVELIARESNARAISLYQSLGFLIEGRLEMRIKTPDGHFEADIPMGWENPNFGHQSTDPQ